MINPKRPYEVAAAHLIAILAEAFVPTPEIKMEETTIGATVKLLLPNGSVLVFSVANQATTAYLSVPQTMNQLRGVKGKERLSNDPITLKTSLYREALRNDPQGDDITGWISMVQGMPEFPKNTPDPKVFRMVGYKVTKNINLFDAAKNRSVEIKKHEVLAHHEQFNVLAQIAVDGKTAYGYIRLIDTRFQAGIQNETFVPLPLGQGLFFLPEHEVLEAAGVQPITKISDSMETPEVTDAFPLGEPKA